MQSPKHSWYGFKGIAGNGQIVNDNAASAWNNCSCVMLVYTDPYQGVYDDIWARHQEWRLDNTYNKNSSHSLW